MVKIKKVYENFGVGNPGWNVTLQVWNDKTNLRGYHSYPNVNGPVTKGVFLLMKPGEEWINDLEKLLNEKGKRSYRGAAEITFLEISDEEWEVFFNEHRRGLPKQPGEVVKVEREHIEWDNGGYRTYLFVYIDGEIRSIGMAERPDYDSWGVLFDIGTQEFNALETEVFRKGGGKARSPYLEAYFTKEEFEKITKRKLPPVG